MKPIIGITMGDVAGIGPEISAKALAHREFYEICSPLVVGDGGAMRQAVDIAKVNLEVHPIKSVDAARFEHGTIDVLDLENVDIGGFTHGHVNAMAGRAAVEFVKKAVDLALKGEIDAIATGPIHKEAVNLAGYHYSGHTELLGDLTGTKDYAMLLVDGNFRVAHVSTHVSLREACDRVKKDRVLKVIKLADQTVRRLGIQSPKVAVAGLNPHAGEGGMFGREEIDEIAPAVEEAKRAGIDAEGPIPPDTVFAKLKGGQYDVVVAMYHDQGHIPTKVLGFSLDRSTMTWTALGGVNVTIGLPIIRTSVDHGVAFGKAGKGTANPQSMMEAIKLAVQLAKSG
ncbi:MAG: 4-hydroxythreonine-4-phosphate dehydrogenase PdxA [bacterium]